jgi:hypothetical protein
MLAIGFPGLTILLPSPRVFRLFPVVVYQRWCRCHCTADS